MAVEITEDILRLAVVRLAELTKEKQFVLVGRGTLAVTAPPGQRSMARSEDIDLWPRFNEKAALDESRDLFGEGTDFHKQHGFYIERLGQWTVMSQPPGWEERATEIKFGNISLLVLGLLDLAYNKLEANRVKDRDFLRQAFKEGLFTPDDLRAFIRQHPSPLEYAAQVVLSNLASIENSPDQEAAP